MCWVRLTETEMAREPYRRAPRHLPAHQLAPQVFEGNLGKTLGEQITELLNRLNLEQLDPSLDTLLLKPDCFGVVVLTVRRVFRWQFLSEDQRASIVLVD